MNGWLGVVSREHAERGAREGIAQVCHGKAAPLRRLKPGDVLVYYSPTVAPGGPPCQAFTALGRVEDDEVFPVDLGNGFVPFRRRIRYAAVRQIPLKHVQDRLDLCASAHWGVALRRGLLPLSGRDLSTLAQAMEVEWGPHAG